MEVLYQTPTILNYNNCILKLVKICSSFIYSPAEMIFVDAKGREVKYADLDVENRNEANKIFNLYRLGRLKFAN